MRAYIITRTDTGQVIGSQTVPDSLAPVLLNGQAAALVPVGFNVASGAFAANGSGTAKQFAGTFNINLSGAFAGGASVALEKSFDGTAWAPATFSDGAPVKYFGPTSTSWTENQAGVWYRLTCAGYVSGSIAWRLSQ